MVSNLDDRDWNVILNNIEWGRCVVQLGPDLCTIDESGNKINLANKLSHKLAKVLKDEKGLQIDDPHNLRLVAQNYEKIMGREYLVSDVISFYQEYEKILPDIADATFESLAVLPFSLFVTSRHDTTLESFFATHKAEKKA